MTTAVTGVRRFWLASVAVARQVPRRKIVLVAVAAAILAAAAVLVPAPTAVGVRNWATSVGPWFPLAFLAAHAVGTVFPIPRSVFTLAAALMFGPLLGTALALLASTASALITLLLIRAMGWQLNRLVKHPIVDSLDERLRCRGWPAIVSLRLITAVPFWALNYAAAASAVRVLPFMVATVLGLIPGTVAFVLLADALTGHINPLLFVVSVITATFGIAGLIFDAGAHRRLRRREAERTAGGSPQ
jgi:uncharacterized membrane protein YdjX (TVP38/TMEM64 family)